MKNRTSTGVQLRSTNLKALLNDWLTTERMELPEDQHILGGRIVILTKFFSIHILHRCHPEDDTDEGCELRKSPRRRKGGKAKS